MITPDIPAISRCLDGSLPVLNSAKLPDDQADDFSPMDNSPILNILIAAQQLADGELLVNALRKAGYSVHAETLETESGVDAQWQRMRWDLLFVLSEEPPLPLALLRTHGGDMGCIVLGKSRVRDPLHVDLPAHCVLSPCRALTKPKDVTRLLHTVAQEVRNLETRRALRAARTALQELQERYHLLLQSASDAVAYLHGGLHVYANDAYVALFGMPSPEALKAQGFLDLVDPQDVDRVREFLRACPDATTSSCVFLGITAPHSLTRLSLQCAPSRYEDEPCVQIIVRPAAGNIAQQERLRAQESRDLLTDLLNRNAISARVDQAIATSIYEHLASTVLMLKLMEFEEFGHAVGRSLSNLMLADVASLIRRELPQDAVLGHIGAGEFVALFPADHDLSLESSLPALGERLNQALFAQHPQAPSAGIGLGIALVNEHAPSAKIVIDRARHHLTVRANQALHPVHTAEDPYADAHEMFARLKKAFEQEDFILVFQPVVNLKEDGIERYEVRIRLQDKGTLIYPPRFLELANQHGLGEQIDRWVCQKTLQLLRERHNPALKLTINLTHNTITNSQFLPWLREHMQKERVTADQISLQISELDIVSSPEQVRQFCQQLKTLGFELSITHFGCTLSPFNFLPLEDASFIKLDKSLLENIDSDTAAQEKLNTTVSSLHARGLLVIAPMIDRIDLLPYLWQANINMVQGNCLQEPSASMNFRFVQDEEITLDSFQ